MSGIWPGETQCVVLLGFDVDGVSSWLNRDPSYANHPSLMSMAEYGPSVATPRILDMLDATSIPSLPGILMSKSTRLMSSPAAARPEMPSSAVTASIPSLLVLRCGVLGRLRSGQDGGCS